MKNKNIYLDYFDLQATKFCLKNTEYLLFRFGSSIYSSRLSFHDIDILIVKRSLNKTYKKDIDYLKNNFSNKEFSKSSFHTFDEKIDVFFKELKINIKVKFNINIQHSFSFGPSEIKTKN